MEFNQINTNTKEGKLLMAALAMLTSQPALQLNGEAKRGTNMTPFEMLDEVEALGRKIYEERFDEVPTEEGIVVN